jgi:cysteine-S-conjugate beta-lyase
VTDPFGLTTFGSADLANRPGAKWAGQQPGAIAAWVADMDFPIAPPIADRLQRRIAVDVGYPQWDDAGRSHLPGRFAERMATRYGWEPDPSRAHETADVMQGVEVAIHHLTAPGDGIVLHTPAYTPFLESIAATGRTLIEVPAVETSDGFGWDYAELEARLSGSLDGPGAPRLWIVCHPQNPTGRVFGRSELECIAEIALRHDLVVVSDEVHAELTYAPEHHVPLAALGDEIASRTVTVTSSSKAFNLAGLRWAIVHTGVQELQEAIAALPRHYLGIPNLLAVEATDAAWTEGDDWLEAVVTQLDANRVRLAEQLAERLPAARFRPPQATYLAWIDCRELGLGDDPVAEFRRRGVDVYDGRRFGAPGAGFVRLNFATSPSVLDEMVSRMAG